MYTKAMVDLINEVRRRVPDKTKAVIKLANPNIIDVLIELYFESYDSALQTLIKEIVTLAGEPWSTQFAQLIREEDNLELEAQTKAKSLVK